MKPNAFASAAIGAEDAEMIDPERKTAIADVLRPAERRTGLDRHAGGHRRRQYFVSVSLRLGVKKFPTGHRNDSRAHALGVEDRLGVYRQRDFGSGGDQDQLRDFRPDASRST